MDEAWPTEVSAVFSNPRIEIGILFNILPLLSISPLRFSLHYLPRLEDYTLRQITPTAPAPATEFTFISERLFAARRRAFLSSLTRDLGVHGP